MTGCVYRMNCRAPRAAWLLAALVLLGAVPAGPAIAAERVAAERVERAAPAQPDGLAGRASESRVGGLCRSVDETAVAGRAPAPGAAVRGRCNLAVAVAVSIRSNPGIF